jgi:hypothetical protein
MDFMSDNFEWRDIHDMFCGLNETTVPPDLHIFDMSATLADLVVYIGVFPSKGQAKKNGWGGEIPFGCNEFKVGKRVFWVWKRQWSDAELEAMHGPVVPGWVDEDDG